MIPARGDENYGKKPSACHENALCIYRGTKYRSPCPEMAVTWSIENDR